MMKYLTVTFLALLALTGCRSARNQYDPYSPPGNQEVYVPLAGYENSAPRVPPVDYGGGVSSGASPGGSCCK